MYCVDEDERKWFDEEIFIKVISTFKLRSLSFYNHRKKEIIALVLSNSFIQHSLHQIKCNYFLLSECDSILSLCSWCKHLESFQIHINGVYNAKYDKEIEEAKAKIIANCENIKNITIYSYN